MAFRRLLLIAVVALAGVSAPAQTRVSGVAGEAAASAQSGASVQGSLGAALSPIPTLGLTVPALGAAPGLVPPAPVAALPAAPALAAPTLALAAPADAKSVPARALAPASSPRISVSPGQATLPGGFGKPTDPRSREARQRIEEARAQWEVRAAAEDAASGIETAAEFLAVQKRSRAATLRLAARQARLGPVEGPLARLGWRLEAARLERAADAVERQDLGVKGLLERAGGRLSETRRRDLEDLRAYVPGLDPARVTGGEELAFFLRGEISAGYATNPLSPGRGAGPETGFVWMSDRLTPAQFVEVAIHEGFHQGDAGYAEGEKDLSRRLDGADAAPLMIALIEGYTELRAREVYGRLGKDAAVQEFGLPKRYGEYLRAQWGFSLESALAARDAALERHPYDPFVELVAAVLERPGGLDALDALVGRGDAGPLEAALGRPLLLKLVAHAEAAEPGKNALPFEARLAESLGVSEWLRRRTAAAARGEEVLPPWMLKRRAYAAVSAAVSALLDAPAWSRSWMMSRLAAVDLRAELESGAPVAVLRGKVEAAARAARRAAWLMAWPHAVSARVGRLDATALLALYAPGGAAALAVQFLFGAAAGPFILLAALGGMWLGLQALGAIRLVRRPSRWLPSRWLPR